MTASLSSALLVATSGLRAAQSNIDAVTRNVSNAQIEGYTRKEVPLETIAFADMSGGVRAREITRQVSEALLRQLRDSTSSADRLTAEDDFLGRFETIFGKPGDAVATSVKIGTLVDAFRAMTVSPELPTNQLKVIDAAQGVVQNLNFVTQNIRALREEADAAIASSVDKVNAALTEVADLNLQIATLQAQSKSTAELEDKRDSQLLLISREIDISYFKRDNGEIHVSTRSGRSLLDSTYDPNNPPLSFNKTPVILASTGYKPPPVSSGLSGIEIEGIDITPEIASGKVLAYLNIRDKYLPQTQSQLDELAARLIQHLNFQDLQLFTNGTQIMPTTISVQDAAGVTAASAGAPSIVTVQDTSGLSAGMTLKFGSHGTIYEITNVDAVNNTVTFAQPLSMTGLTEDIDLNDRMMFGPAIPQVSNQLARSVGQGATSANPIEITSLVGLEIGSRIKFANHDTIYTITDDGTSFPDADTTAAITNAGDTTISVTSAATYRVGDRIDFASLPGETYDVTAVDTTGGTITIQRTGVGGGLSAGFAAGDAVNIVHTRQFLLEPDGNGVGLQAAISSGEQIQVVAPISGLSGTANSIAVNATVINNPWRVRDGTRVEAPSILTGNNEIPTDIVAMFEALQTFSTNTGLTPSATIENFAAAMISFQANRRAATSTQLESQNVIRDNFDRRVKDDSGVNVDQELAFMLQVQNSYAASGRTIAAIREMLDELLRIVG